MKKITLYSHSTQVISQIASDLLKDKKIQKFAEDGQLSLNVSCCVQPRTIARIVSIPEIHINHNLSPDNKEKCRFYNRNAKSLKSVQADAGHQEIIYGWHPQNRIYPDEL